MAAHNARVERGDTQVFTDAVDAATANRGCPLGTLGWARAECVTVSAPLCASDFDCPTGTRCRLLDDDDPRTTPPVVLADNHTQGELDRMVSKRGTGEGALFVCDARWKAAPERVEQVAAVEIVESAEP